jgi:hypothetical protein
MDYVLSILTTIRKASLYANVSASNRPADISRMACEEDSGLSRPKASADIAVRPCQKEYPTPMYASTPQRHFRRPGFIVAVDASLLLHLDAALDGVQS